MPARVIWCGMEGFAMGLATDAQPHNNRQWLRDILEAVTVTGEQVGFPEGHEREWIDAVVGALHTPGEQQIKLFDGRSKARREKRRNARAPARAQASVRLAA